MTPEQMQNEWAARLKAMGLMIKVGNDIFTAPDFDTAAGMAVNSSFRLLRFKTAAIAEISEGRSRIAAQYGQTAVNQHSEQSEFQNALCEKLVFEENSRTLAIKAEDAANYSGRASEAIRAFTARGESLLAVRLPAPAFLGKVSFELIWLLQFEGEIPPYVGNTMGILMHNFGSALFCQKCCKSTVQQRIRKQFSTRRIVLAVLAVLVLLLMFFPVRNTVNTEFVLKAPETFSVYAWFDGPIAKCFRQDGEIVKKGDIIATYDTNQLRFRLANAESQYKEIRKEYELESAAAFADRERLGRAQLIAARMEGAKVAVDEARWYLQHTDLKAPADGILALADGRAELLVNKALRTGDRVFDVYSGKGAVAEIQVDQREGSILLDKFDVSLFLYTEPDKELSCKVVEVQQYPVINEQRTYCYKVRAELLNADSLRCGMRGVAKLRGERVSLGYYLFKNIVIYLRWL
jgi:hypothetical protein